MNKNQSKSERPDSELKNEITKKWEDRCSKFLVGKTIKSVRYLYTSEMKDLGWTKKALVLFFDEGYMYASSDDEGNNAGAYFCSFEGLEGIPTI